jgi:hypothetical protein
MSNTEKQEEAFEQEEAERLGISVGEPIVVVYDDENVDDETWNIVGEDTYVSWKEDEGSEFVDALLELVMERARRRAMGGRAVRPSLAKPPRAARRR